MKKNLFAIITMAISIGVLVYFLITTDGITAFAEIAGSIQIPWFISIFAAIIVGWLLEALVLHFFCKKVYPQWKYWHSLILDTLKKEIESKGITYTYISNTTGISVDKLSRTFLKKRKLQAEELILICLSTGIDIDKLRKCVSTPKKKAV